MQEHYRIHMASQAAVQELEGIITSLQQIREDVDGMLPVDASHTDCTIPSLGYAFSHELIILYELLNAAHSSMSALYAPKPLQSQTSPASSGLMKFVKNAFNSLLKKQREPAELAKPEVKLSPRQVYAALFLASEYLSEGLPGLDAHKPQRFPRNAEGYKALGVRVAALAKSIGVEDERLDSDLGINPDFYPTYVPDWLLQVGDRARTIHATLEQYGKMVREAAHPPQSIIPALQAI